MVTNVWPSGYEYTEGGNKISLYLDEIQFVDEKTGKQITVYLDDVTYGFGSKVLILYHPDNPTNFRVGDRYLFHLSWTITYILFGVIVLLFPVYMTYLKRKREGEKEV